MPPAAATSSNAKFSSRRARPFAAYRCDETARNLRLLQQLSLVICTATGRKLGRSRARARHHQRRLEPAHGLGHLLSPAAGSTRCSSYRRRRTSAARIRSRYARYLYQPESQSVGFGYRIPRLAGRRLDLAATRASSGTTATASAEGSSGSVEHRQAALFGAHRMGVGGGGQLAQRDLRAAIRTGGSRSTRETGVPWQYRARRVAEAAYITRSFGLRYKHDFTLGAEMNIRSCSFARRPRRRSRRQCAAFARANCRAATPASAPSRSTAPTPRTSCASSTSKRSACKKTFDSATMHTSGSIRSRRSSDSSRSFPRNLRRLAIHDQTGRRHGARRNRNRPWKRKRSHLSDAWLELSLRLVTPRLGIGRLVFDAGALNRYRNYLNRQSYLGGDGRLRGYPSSYFVGKDVIVYNLEFRSRPVEILSCQLGAAAFYDVGHAANGWDHPPSAPIRRLRLPRSFSTARSGRLSRRHRISIQRPLDPDVPAFTASIAFEQAFPVPSVGGRASAAVPSGWIGQ